MKQKSKQTPKQDKKNYAAPILQHIGTIEELTRGAASGRSDSGGSQVGGMAM